MTLNFTQSVLVTYVPCLLTLLGANADENARLSRTVGQALSKNDPAIRPDIKFRGTAVAEATAGGAFNVTDIKYTVLCMDGNFPGSSNPNGYNLHYLENDISTCSCTSQSVGVTSSSSCAFGCSLWRERRSHRHTEQLY